MKKTKKKTTAVSKSIHFKKIANRLFSEYLQNIIDKLDENSLVSNIHGELLPVPLAFQHCFDDYLKKFSTYLVIGKELDSETIKASINIDTLTCKGVYKHMISFIKLMKNNVFIKNKKHYDNIFFATSYNIALSCLNKRSLRKLYGIKKGFFG